MLVAYRYGWVPPVEEGGDGKRSITRIEYEHARALGIPVIPLVVAEKTSWDPSLIEALENHRIRQPLADFKRELCKGLAGFFSSPQSVEALLPIPLQRAGEDVSRLLKPGRVEQSFEPDVEAVIPYYADLRQPPTVEERLNARLPKRILALDGAGVRSGITLGYLERLERLLQIRYGSEDLRVSDYFDLIGGVGPAALIAALLARRASVAEVKPIFGRAIQALTSRKRLLGALRGALYDDAGLRALLQEVFGDTTIADPSLRTGLCMLTTRFNDGSTLSFSNHPTLRDLPGSRALLRELILASTALPLYLSPPRVQLDSDRSAFLASGDVSVGPDPALHLFTMATERSGAFRWRTGRRWHFLLSLGGGTWRDSSSDGEHSGRSTLQLIQKLVNFTVAGLRQQSTRLLDTLTFEGPSGPTEGVGDATQSAYVEPVLTYRRFDVALEDDWLKKNDLEQYVPSLDKLVTLDDPSSYSMHLTLGQMAAARQLRDVFLPYFDVLRPVANDWQGSRQPESGDHSK